MHRWTDPTQTPDSLRPCVVTLGNFDGVHRGHQAVLDQLRRIAAAHGLPAVAVTFDPHPLAVLRPDSAPELLTPGPLRDDLLDAAGLDG
ncbi:MAG TPA: bifunctional riboflavin kinase/FAD synthetase, partial [Phycicoccus sp.]|nr:bifunctional riboflavin kinase/FAD synthetase [Phycicoccus sp.]